MTTNYLDFYDILVNRLVGDPTLFLVLVFLIVSITLIRARAPNSVLLYALFIVAAMLSVWFEILRWIVVVGGLGFAGWVIFARLRRE